jgi:hypothetical protein
VDPFPRAAVPPPVAYSAMDKIRFAYRTVAAVAVGALILLAGPTSGAMAAPASVAQVADAASPSAAGTVITVSGVVRAGIFNPNCRILVPFAGGTVYVMVGGPAVKLGVPVLVRGTLNPGLRHSCGEGVSLLVQVVAR